MSAATIIQIAKDIILGCAAIFTATMAYRGLSTWRKQLKGNAEFENARRFMLCLYRMRNAISAVRNSFMGPAEIEAAMVEAGHPADQVARLAREKGVDAEVYNRRWAALADTIAPLEVELLEMEVLHGANVRKLYRDLYKLVLELRYALNQYLRNLRAESEPHLSGRPRPDYHEERERLTRIIWEDYEEIVESEPAFSRRLHAAFSELEAFTKQFLRE